MCSLTKLFHRTYLQAEKKYVLSRAITHSMLNAGKNGVQREGNAQFAGKISDTNKQITNDCS